MIEAARPIDSGYRRQPHDVKMVEEGVAHRRQDAQDPIPGTDGHVDISMGMGMGGVEAQICSLRCSVVHFGNCHSAGPRIPTMIRFSSPSGAGCRCLGGLNFEAFQRGVESRHLPKTPGRLTSQWAPNPTPPWHRWVQWPPKAPSDTNQYRVAYLMASREPE